MTSQENVSINSENARLLEVERRHLSLLYDISRELISSLDPDEILDRALSLICQTLEGKVGQAYLYLTSEERVVVQSIYGRPKETIQQLNRWLKTHPDQGLANWVAKNRQPVCIPVVTHDHRWYFIPGIDDEVRSAISAPIINNDNLLGVLSVLHQKPGFFSAEHQELMQAICQEVGLALINASRYQQAQRQLAEITLIQDLAQTFNQRLEPQVLLDEVVAQLVKKFAYPQIRIFLLEGNLLVLKAIHGPHPPKDSYSMETGIIGRVARTGQVAFVPDVTQDPDYQACIHESVSELAVPIFQGKNVVGVINIECDQLDQLNDQDCNILQVLAGQISVALENANLYERVRRHAEDLEHTVLQRTAELTELYELSQEIGNCLSFEELLQLLVNHLLSAARSEFVVGYLFAGNYRSFQIAANRPLSSRIIDEVHSYCQQVLTSEGKIDIGLETAEIELVRGAAYQEAGPALQEAGALIHAPVYLEEKIVGLIMAGSECASAFGAEEIQLLNTFANQATAAVQRLAAVLIAQQKHLENLVEHMPVGTVLLDGDFNVLVANPLGREILSVLNPKSDGKGLTHLGSCSMQELIAHQNDPVPVEIILDSPIRRYFGAQIRSVHQEFHQWVLTVQEVTQERERQARIQGQERLATVGQLAAGIAHDFNNIMAAILVYADLLRFDTNIPPSSREKLNIIQQQVQRAASLIRQILDFSRRSIMDPSDFDLLPFIKELDKLLGRVLPETIRLELKYKPATYWVNADPTRLQQVFINLALNARDAMPGGGVLHFELNRFHLEAGSAGPFPNMPVGDWIRIIVMDSGAGISPEVREHIFEPFFTTKPAGQGTGLGLAQVYGIIKQHDGYIDVQSREGEGTTFIIYLPALAMPEPIESPNDPFSIINGLGETVLVVEDDRATREAMQAMLQAQNYNVFAATNGAEALYYCEQADVPISLVVSDVVMPQMGGLTLYHNLQERWPNIKMLFVTGHPMESENQSMLEKGNVHWLQKPFSIKDFNQAINDLTRGG
jgi:signal transduction histidine kinase/GAF domain-containing protein